MSRDPDCIFCKIAAGGIPCEKVLETAELIAFLDINPLADGHVLVVPKDHCETLDTMPTGLAARVCEHLPRLGKALLSVTEAAGYNLLQNNGRVAGQEVGHVHFHLIPRAEGDGLGYRWLPKGYPEGRAAEIGGRLREAMAGPD